MSEDKKTLHELVNIAAQIEDMLIESSGEITPELEALIEIKEHMLPVKVEGYAGLISRMETVAQFYKDKADFFTRISKASENFADHLKFKIKESMIRLGQDEMLGVDTRFKLAKAQPKLVIDNEIDIPDSYRIIVTTAKIDNAKLKDSLKCGTVVTGARLEESYSLRTFPIKK